MGIPANSKAAEDSQSPPQASESSSYQAPPNTTQAAAPPSSPANLPPAALELAGKLFDLARAGTTDTLSQYLGAGVPANLTNSTGDTLLMLAAYHGHAATVRALLQAGADPDVLNDRGQSPLAGAVFKGHDEVVRALFEAGASTTQGQPNAVDAARMFRREAMCELFGVETGEGGPPGTIPGAPAMR